MADSLVLDGKSLAKEIQESLKERVIAIKGQNGGVTPILATILVGNDPASDVYITMKGNACRRVGMDSQKVLLSDSATTEELLFEINKLNEDRNVLGILLQHPVPSQINERICFEAIDVNKDVDGVTCLGFGRMVMGESAYGSATPQGIMKILEHYNIPIKGKHAVVVGRSPILGKPMAMMLLNKHATVTLCHSRTQNLPDIVRQADIVVGAVGKPKFIKGDWVKEGAVVIDAGFHPEKCGDVDLEAVIGRCSAYTPVPGGVGPMTICTLITQTVEAAERALEGDVHDFQNMNL